MYTEEELIAFGKNCFYKGFDKAENDDANCFTAWREEAKELLNSVKKLTNEYRSYKHKRF